MAVRLNTVQIPHPSICEGMASYGVVQSNVRATEAVMGFTNGDHRALMVSGPSGVGKSHLLRSVVLDTKAKVELASAQEWLSGRTQLRDAPIAAIDDLHTICARSSPRLMMRKVLEYRLRSGKPTLLCWNSDQSQAILNTVLPAGWDVVHIGKPTKIEAAVILKQLLQNEELSMSDRLCHILAQRLPSNGHTFQGLVQRLKLHANDWNDPSQEFRALGLAYPLLSQEDGWDLREHIHECIHESIPQECSEWARPMAIYFMRRAVGLGECDVAGFYQASQGDVYHDLLKTEQGLQDTQLQRVFGEVFEALVNSLDHD